MQPAVEIFQRGDRHFNAYVGIGDGTRRYAREGLHSIADCVHDAATALGSEFGFATIIYDDMMIGSYPVAVMGHSPVEVADELIVRRYYARKRA